MGWHVYGSQRGLSFRVDVSGLSISGEGEQRIDNPFPLIAPEINGLSARWTIWRASEAAELAGQFGLVVRDMK
jgi:hypothetical protein